MGILGRWIPSVEVRSMNNTIQKAIEQLMESVYFDETDLEWYPSAGFTDAIDELRALLDEVAA